MNKRGLSSGLLAIIVVLFLFALISIISFTGWNFVNNTFQNMDNETVSQSVKDDINELSSFMGWGDRIFVLFFIALLIGFMVTSFTSTTENPVYIVLYFLFLILISIVAMIVSNGWGYLIENPNLAAAALELPFTTWFMVYLPVIIFFMGLIGGVIFYARRRTSGEGNSYNIDFKEGGDGLE